MQASRQNPQENRAEFPYAASDFLAVENGAQTNETPL